MSLHLSPKPARHRRPITVESWPGGWAWICRECDTQRGMVEAIAMICGIECEIDGYGLPSLAAAADAGRRHLREVHGG